MMLKILNFFLFLGFISGLFSVSAGAYIIIKIKHITDNTIFIGRVILAYMAKYVPPIKSNKEVIKQDLLSFACIPKVVNRGML